MSIVHMCFKREEAPADAVNLRNATESWRSEGWESSRELWLYESHAGLCIKEREVNGYDDSDFYMTVWNPEKNEPESICFASTRGWTYPCLGSFVDASPDVMAKYRAWEIEGERKAREAKLKAREKTPERGKTLKVVKGRKVPIGTTGTCIWTGFGKFGERVGIKDDSGTVHWTAMSNVEVMLPGENPGGGGPA